MERCVATMHSAQVTETNLLYKTRPLHQRMACNIYTPDYYSQTSSRTLVHDHSTSNSCTYLLSDPAGQPSWPFKAACRAPRPQHRPRSPPPPPTRWSNESPPRGASSSELC